MTLNSTGSTYDSIGGFGSNLVPILDYSVTGRGTSSDPYVWSASFEFTSSEVTTYNLPTSNQFMTWWVNSDPRVSTKLWTNFVNIGNNTSFTSNIADRVPISSSLPANTNPDPFNFIIFNQGLLMALFFTIQLIA